MTQSFHAHDQAVQADPDSSMDHRGPDCCTQTRCSVPVLQVLQVSQGTPAVLGQVVAFVWRSTGAVLGQGYGVYRCCGPDSAYCLEVPQLQFITVVVIPVIKQRQIRVVLVTKRFPCFRTK